MIIILKEYITDAQMNHLNDLLTLGKYGVTKVRTQTKNILVCTGERKIDLVCSIINLEGVEEVHLVSDDNKLVNKKWKSYNSIINLGDNIFIGGSNKSIIAGPCFMESEEQMQEIVYHFLRNKIRILRGAVFKPINYPNALSGAGITGLKILHSLCAPYGIKILSEVMQVTQIEEMMPYVDIFQVGARNSQNFNLLDALAEIDKPILIKRSIGRTIEDLLHSAEHVFSKGNEKLILCEIGIRNFENTYRNTFDVNAIQVLKEKTHLPVIAEPSHGVGIKNYVTKMALASLVCGADGVMYELHEKPEEMQIGHKQILSFSKSEQLVNMINSLGRSDLRK